MPSYPDRFGAANLVAMRDGFGTFASPQNAFFSGRVAMILQGVWIHNFIKNYAPADFEWGVAAFPGMKPGEQISIINTDLLVIPRGAKHPREAFEFMAYVNSQQVMEKLCLGQKKFSPLRRCSPEFFVRHPNPQIRKFLELATGPGARPPPQVPIWNELSAGMKNAVSKIWSGSSDAASALQDVQTRQQKALDRRTARWKAVGPLLEEQWSRQ
ncbi:MAG: hypothetical protein Fur0032_24380 [Terrimicrobiaceae bacterium]